MVVLPPREYLADYLKLLRYRYWLFRVIVTILLGKNKRDEIYRKHDFSFLSCSRSKPQKTPAGFLCLPRDSTDDFELLFMPREKKVQPYLKINDAEIFVDVGANVGYYSLKNANEHRDDEIRVIAVEANKENFEALVRNVKCNKFINIVCINKAVSDTKGFGTLYKHQKNGLNLCGRSSLVYKNNESNQPSNYDQQIETVEMDTLDNILDSLGIKKVDLLKIDVEGAEITVLEGSKETLKNVQRLVIEIHGDNLPKVKHILHKYKFFLEELRDDMQKEVYVYAHR